jgi:hypothetical protein
MVQASKDGHVPLQMDTLLASVSNLTAMNDPTRTNLPPWSTRSHQEDRDVALNALSRRAGPAASPYRLFPTYVAEPDFAAKGITRPAYVIMMNDCRYSH